MKAIKIDTAGNVSVAEFPAPIYDGLGKLLNGTPEHVRPKRLKRPYCMMVDDEFCRKGLPSNPAGCWLYQTDKHGSPIAGDIYLMKEIPCGPSYDVAGLDDNDIAILKEEIMAIPEPWKPRGGVTL